MCWKVYTYWDYAPKAISMGRAALAWEGKMGNGNTAYLYRTEWINPYPSKTIEKVIFASTPRPVEANPILIAATAVLADLDDAKSAPPPAYPWGPRTADLLKPQNPVGKKIDLTAGKLESDQVWRTADGITISQNEPLVNKRSLETTQPEWNSIANIIWENDEGVRLREYRTSTTLIALPGPRVFTGLRVNSLPRWEIGTILDYKPAIVNYKIFVSTDGKNFQQVFVRDAHIPDEEGPLWVALPEKPVQAIRIEQQCNYKDMIANSIGLELVELYEP